jgi:hypothetical protein
LLAQARRFEREFPVETDQSASQCSLRNLRVTRAQAAHDFADPAGIRIEDLGGNAAAEVKGAALAAAVQMGTGSSHQWLRAV